MNSTDDGVRVRVPAIQVTSISVPVPGEPAGTIVATGVDALKSTVQAMVTETKHVADNTTSVVVSYVIDLHVTWVAALPPPPAGGATDSGAPLAIANSRRVRSLFIFGRPVTSVQVTATMVTARPL